MVLNYVGDGNLRNYLQKNHSNLTLKDRITPYIATEILHGNKNTKESDVYSIGMLMWEIFSDCPPFNDRAHDYHLILDICKGLRPPILTNMPKEYVEMMQRCWDVDPSKRPTIRELCN